MKILAIGAHPDDIEIFMYGCLSACKERGDTIVTTVVTDGSAGGVIKGSKLAYIREQEAKDGLIFFGKPIFLRLKDGELIVNEKTQRVITDLIKLEKPDFIITHDPCDYHPDHRELSRLVSNGAGFECPVFFAETLMGVNFRPEFFVDITKFIEYKKKSILSHVSQNPNKFLEAAVLLNRFRAAQCNLPANNFVETYRTSRRFPFTDIRGLLPPPPKLRPFYTNNISSMI